MRTVTFSNPEMAVLLNENFICTWENRKPGFHNCEFMTEKSIANTAVFATKNFATFFITPEEGVLHYLSGYYSPEFFRREVEFVMDVRRRFMDDKCRLNPRTYAAYQALHRDVGKLLMDEIEMPKDAKQEWNRHSVNEGLRHLSQVHAFLGKPRADLVAVKKLKKNHLSGNEFTEEDSRPDSAKKAGGKGVR